jgi:hypothetical protein
MRSSAAETLALHLFTMLSFGREPGTSREVTSRLLKAFNTPLPNLIGGLQSRMKPRLAGAKMQ